MITARAIAMLILTTGSLRAAPVTLDFEDFLQPGERARGAPQYEGNGFIVDGNTHIAIQDDGYGCGGGCAANGTDAVYIRSDFYFNNGLPYYQNYITLTRAGGEAFRLLGLDYAEYFLQHFNSPIFDHNSSEFHIRGYRGLNLEFDFSLQVDGIVDGPGGQADFQTVNFMLPAADTVILFGSGGLYDQAFSVDNIRLDTVDDVPAPAAGAILALGLVILGRVRSRMRPAA